MELQTNKFSYYHEFPPALNPDHNNSGEGISAIQNSKNKKFAEGSPEINLPILATANDLREAVKFFKHKPNGVSIVEIMNAEPRRVFDARKIAAYEFWGIVERVGERLQLTGLGEELARNTAAECEINRRILHSIPAYSTAVEWIFRQKIEIAAYHDVADFWRRSPDSINLSLDNESNIEAVIVSFFSLCHAAELGTATVGKRGQPARLNVNFHQINLFLKSKFEDAVCDKVLPVFYPNNSMFSHINQEKVDCVYISGENSGTAIENLSDALELADFSNIAYIVQPSPHELLPNAQIDLMKCCQAAVFLLDEKDCVKQKGSYNLHCARVAEISVARALFGERVIIVWKGPEAPPNGIRQSGVNSFVSEHLDWETNVKLVKYLKNLKN